MIRRLWQHWWLIIAAWHLWWSASCLVAYDLWWAVFFAVVAMLAVLNDWWTDEQRRLRKGTDG